MKLFDVKEDNSLESFALAYDKAVELDSDIVLATTSGNTALRFAQFIEGKDFNNKVVVVSHAYGTREKGVNAMSEEIRKQLTDKGFVIVTAAHALSGVERGLSNTFKGVYPAEIVAHTLRMLSAGVKVCVEISLMACDAGAITYRKPVVCIGGTGKNADTVCVITPTYSANLLETKVNDILCKPSLYE
ncbi:MAG: hypothetical protein J6Z03_01525 [Erysipelotrichaceae bacterium]|nr:hypothetical protein [Erysipelotrichaceae bacterium]